VKERAGTGQAVVTDGLSRRICPGTQERAALGHPPATDGQCRSTRGSATERVVEGRNQVADAVQSARTPDDAAERAGTGQSLPTDGHTGLTRSGAPHNTQTEISR
jgi:hypothetical protein